MSNFLEGLTKTATCEFGGRKFSIETGKMAKQADGAVLARCGDTVVLVATTSSRKLKPGQSFFPLTVDYIEKYYAAGRFPGGFFKREARPSGDATLNARLIDRPLRPLFPENYMYDTHVHATVLSVDDENDPELLASVAASAALTISDIPFNGPTASVRVGRVDGKLIINPSLAEQANSDMELLVAGSETAIMMVEGGAHEVPEKEVLEAITFAHKELQTLIQLQKELREKTGNKEKREFIAPTLDAQIVEKVRSFCGNQLTDAFSISEKLDRYAKLDEIKSAMLESVVNAEAEDAGEQSSQAERAFGDLKYETMRSMIVDDKRRLDGRSMTKIRPIATEVSLLPRTHGSALFTRGETQVLAVVTLGTKEDEQIVDNMRTSSEESPKKRFMLHYNFPPFSVGETGPLRPPGRREIGHGALAERSVEVMIPTDRAEFPYTVRIVCETLESNGSSSMGSVCSATMALMDAGVPIKKPVAGIAMGLIKEKDKIEILSDILGDEDHLGDMDFKVAGTKDGVTAIQMDIKIDGVTQEIMEKALEQAKEGRLHILGEMAKSINEVRTELNEYAPRVYPVKIAQDKIAEVIGTGGKVIRGIIEECGVKIDIDDTGLVNIVATNKENAEKAKDMVLSIVEEVEVGNIYNGTVKRIVDFGAFVGVTPSTDGLLHISEIANERVRDVRDYLKEGDKIKVKVLDVDRTGRVRLSHKALLENNAD